MSAKIILRVIQFGFFVIISGLFYLQIIEGDFYYTRAKRNYIKIIPQEAERGIIFDREGRRLAFDKAMFNIAVIPYQVRKEKERLLKEIAQFLNIDEKILFRNFKRNWQGPFLPDNILINIGKEKALKIKEKFKDKVIINISPLRFYPYPYAFSHLLGYVKRKELLSPLKKYGYSLQERVGVRGIERFYDEYLRGESGTKVVEVDAKGRVVGLSKKIVPKKGRDIYLTVDACIQKIAYQVLRGRRGAIILMDSNSGEILALVSSPSFNLNNFVQGKKIEKILKDKRFPLINRTLSCFAPGSIFKPIVALAGLEEKVITLSTVFECKGEFKIGDRKFSCWSKHGMQNVIDAIKNSCNVYFYNLGLRLGVDKISRWAKIFRLNKPTGIDLPYEKKGIVPSRNWKLRYKGRRWWTGDTLNFSIGQGYLEITPLEAIVAISAFANGGYIVRPHLFKKAEGINLNFQKEKLSVSKENLEIVRRGLIEAVKTGTAHILGRLNLKIAGKTGTAQNPHGVPHGWFVGFFPYDKPHYSICIFLENGGSSFNAVVLAYKFLEELKKEDLISYEK